MLTGIKGYYDKGQIIMTEEAPVDSKTDVIIMFLPKETEQPSPKKRTPGILKGLIEISDDFDEPLDDLKDYM